MAHDSARAAERKRHASRADSSRRNWELADIKAKLRELAEQVFAGEVDHCAVLRYDDPQDEEAVELQERIRDRGARAVLSQCAGVDEDHPLVKLVLAQIEER